MIGHLSPPSSRFAWVARRFLMDQNQNYITLEMNIKFQMKDYRLVLGFKKTWIIILIVSMAQIIAWLIRGHTS